MFEMSSGSEKKKKNTGLRQIWGDNNWGLASIHEWYQAGINTETIPFENTFIQPSSHFQKFVLSQ